MTYVESNDNKQPLSVEVENKIIQDYFSGEYNSPLLPSERELCDRYQVSRVTLRETLQSLTVKGYVERVQGKGVLKVDNSKEVLIRSLKIFMDRKNVDLHSILEMRFLLECKLAKQAALNITDEEILQLEKLVAKMKELDFDYYNYLQVDFQFHLNIAKASGNLLLYTFVEALLEKMLEIVFSHTKKRVHLQSSYLYHETILEAIKTHNAEEAEKQMMRHLLNSENNISQTLLKK